MNPTDSPEPEPVSLPPFPLFEVERPADAPSSAEVAAPGLSYEPGVRAVDLSQPPVPELPERHVFSAAEEPAAVQAAPEEVENPFYSAPAAVAALPVQPPPVPVRVVAVRPGGSAGPDWRGSLVVAGAVLMLAGFFLAARVVLFLGAYGEVVDSLRFGLFAGWVAGVLLVWLGLGSVLAQRWVRPVILAHATLAVAGGLCVLLGLSGWTFWHQGGLRVELPLFVSVARISIFLVPFWLLLWFYGTRAVHATLEKWDAGQTWTDRLPGAWMVTTVLCFHESLALTWVALFGRMPVFGHWVTGQAALPVAGGAAALALLAAVLLGRGSFAGWWLSLLVNTAVAVSLVWTLLFPAPGAADATVERAVFAGLAWVVVLLQHLASSRVSPAAADR